MSQPNRHSFCHFLGRDLEDKTPDARTIWLFRAQLTRHERHKTLFERFDQQLVSQGGRVGLARTALKIGLMNLVYNMRRLVQIDRLRASGV